MYNKIKIIKRANTISVKIKNIIKSNKDYNNLYVLCARAGA